MWKEVTILVGWLIVSCVAVLRRRRGGASERFPPGPFAWPVIGHLHLFSLHALPHQALRDLSLKYGHILGLRLGQRRAVVVSSPDLAKQVLLTHDKAFAGRLPPESSSIMFFGASNGITFSHGPAWRKHRKVCMLRLFTAKRVRELEHLRQQEIHALLLSIHHQSSVASTGTGATPINLNSCVAQMASRLMMRLLHSQATAQICGESLHEMIKEQEQQLSPTVGDFIPSLSWLDFFKKQRMRRLHARVDKVYTKIVMERNHGIHVHDDLLHTLLQDETFTLVEIKSILSEMVGAGIHTTALTLEWIMAELLKNQNCLRRLQSEIDTQLGDKKEVTDVDLPKLDYLKCVIKEASRLHPVAPLLLPHMSVEECNLQGYMIPSKTLMYVNVWAIGRDEQVWPNASEFMPERFEGKDIDLKGQHFELLPFGSGRRGCLGLPLAIPLIEATLANLVSHFDWELPKEGTETSINMDEKMGLTANRATPLIVIPKLRATLSKFTNKKAYSKEDQNILDI